MSNAMALNNDALLQFVGLANMRPFNAILIVIAVIGLFAAVTRKTRTSKLDHIPILGAELGDRGRKKEFRYNAKAFLGRGYEEFNKFGKTFQVHGSEGPMVLLNAAQTVEVGSMPDHIVDNMRPNGRGVMDAYTGYLDGDQVIYRMIKTQLSTRLHELSSVLAQQTDTAMAQEVPDCKDWTRVQIYKHLTRVVAIISSRIFLGEELTTNEEWIAITVEYTEQLMVCATILKLLPAALRPLLYRFVPAYRNLRRINKAAIRIITPIVKARREAMERGDSGCEKQGEGDNMLHWMLEERRKKQFRDKDYEYMAQFQLQMSFAAIHTTSVTVTNLLYDLIAWPEYIGVLREEIKEQLALHGGEFTAEVVKGLKKMDSCMKESQRHNPVGFTIMGRDICEDITLSDGTFLPKGTFVAANNYQITHDPDVLQSDSDPNIFEGLRYYNLSETLLKNGLDEKGVAGKHQFVSVSNSSLMFGYGKHACPGRFFAANEIKLVLAKLLLRYEIEMPEGETGRYPNKTWEVSNFVDHDKTIMMKQIMKE